MQSTLTRCLEAERRIVKNIAYLKPFELFTEPVSFFRCQRHQVLTNPRNHASPYTENGRSTPSDTNGSATDRALACCWHLGTGQFKISKTFSLAVLDTTSTVKFVALQFRKDVHLIYAQQLYQKDTKTDGARCERQSSSYHRSTF